MGFDSITVRRELGASLRKARKDARLSAEAAGQIVGRSQPTMWRVENGQASVNSWDLTKLAKAYGVGEDEHLRWQQMLQDVSGGSHWRFAYQQWLTPRYMELIDVENVASSLTSINLHLVPGMLQTSAYTRGLLESGPMPPTPEQAAALDEVRRLRQQRLDDDDPICLTVLLPEPVLDYRYTASVRDHRDQMRHLRTMCDHPRVTIQIIPCHRMVDMSQADLYEFADGGLPVVYTESLLTTTTVESRYSLDVQVVSRLISNVKKHALSPERSVEAIEKRVK